MKLNRYQSPQRAFTLIELLVVMAIVGVLAALLFPAMQSARRNSDIAVETSNLRQTAMAVMSYAGDNDGYLPGPLDINQSGRYGNNLGNSLGKKLYLYINATKPSGTGEYIAPILDNPAHLRYSGTVSTGAFYKCPAYVMNQIVTDATGATHKPWGYNNTGTPDDPVQKLATVAGWSGLSNIWAMQDIDQANCLAAVGSKPSWYNLLPKTPFNVNCRIVMYYDWHVGRVAYP